MSSLTLLASTPGGAEADAVPLGIATGKVSVKPGASKPVKLKVTLPASLPAGPGIYVLLVRLSAGGALAAPNTTDGTTMTSVQVTLA